MDFRSAVYLEDVQYERLNEVSHSGRSTSASSRLWSLVEMAPPPKTRHGCDWSTWLSGHAAYHGCSLSDATRWGVTATF